MIVAGMHESRRQWSPPEGRAKSARMRESLAESMGPIAFSDLRAHLARGAVIVVDAALDLLEVGEAVARDDKARVAGWIETGQLGKPSLETVERWSKAERSIWTALVVQPFVLVREEMPVEETSVEA